MADFVNTLLRIPPKYTGPRIAENERDLIVKGCLVWFWEDVSSHMMELLRVKPDLFASLYMQEPNQRHLRQLDREPGKFFGGRPAYLGRRVEEFQARDRFRRFTDSD